MNTNALYTELKKNLEVKKTNFKQGNIIDKIKKTIMDLNIKRESQLIRFSQDTYYQHIYRGAILSEDDIWKDFDKSIEYEALFESILEIIDKKQIKTKIISI